MSYGNRFLYLFLNLGYGGSLGGAAALAAHQEEAWTGAPSSALLLAGAVAIFGSAYVATTTLRGHRPTLRGAFTVAAAAGAVFTVSTIAVSAPGWVLVWIGAAVGGSVTGLLQPLPPRRGVAG